MRSLDSAEIGRSREGASLVATSREKRLAEEGERRPGVSEKGEQNLQTANAPSEAQVRQVLERFGLDLSRYPERSIQALTRGAKQEATGLSMVELVLSTCSIGETMFLRHPEQFEALRKLAATLPSYGEVKPIRMWSAGCATGEEAYSMVATMEPVAPAGTQVLGTDLNRTFIDWAKRGRYRPWSLRGLNLANSRLEEWLVADGQGVTVRDQVRKRVEFAVHNLAGDPYPTGLDVIFCRNVLLYFQAGAAAATLDGFAHSLRAGGLLFLGLYDPEPTDKSLWAIEEQGGVRFFRRRRKAAESSEKSAPPPPVSQKEPAVHSTVLKAAAETRQEKERGDALIQQARELATQRQLAPAIQLLEQACIQAALTVEPHTLLSLVAAEAGQDAVAVQAARRACFLDPEAPVPHWLLAQSLEALGEHEQAICHFNIAAAKLETLADKTAELAYGEGLTAQQLRRMVHEHLRFLRNRHTF